MKRKTYVTPATQIFEMQLENHILSNSINASDFNNGNDDWFTPSSSRPAGPFANKPEDAPQWPYK